MSARLAREITLLFRVEAIYKLPANPIIDHLVQAERAKLPDLLPPVPTWTKFKWPSGDMVDYETYWKLLDKGLVRQVAQVVHERDDHR